MGSLQPPFLTSTDSFFSEDLADPETGSSSSTEVTGGEEISTLNISDPDIDTEDALEWDVLQDVIDRSKKVPRLVFTNLVKKKLTDFEEMVSQLTWAFSLKMIHRAIGNKKHINQIHKDI